jgi:hypothetical protein
VLNRNLQQMIVLIIAISACASFGAMAALSIQRQYSIASWVAVSMLLPFAGVILLPAIIATVAAIHTGQHLRQEPLHLLRLTHLSEEHVTWGYLAAALHPFQAVLLVELILIYFLRPHAALPFEMVLLSSREQAAVIVPAGAMILLGLVGMNLLGAAIGVRLAFQWTETTVGAAAGVGTLTLMAALLAAGPLTAINLSTSWVAVMAGAALFMVAPYLAASWIMEDARRYLEHMQG